MQNIIITPVLVITSFLLVLATTYWLYTKFSKKYNSIFFNIISYLAILLTLYLELTGENFKFYDRVIISNVLNHNYSYHDIDGSSLGLFFIGQLFKDIFNIKFIYTPFVILNLFTQLWLIKKISVDKGLSLVLLFGLVFYYNDLQLIKSGFSITFVMLSYYLYVKNKYTKSFIIYIIAVLIHVGSIVFLIPWFMTKFQIRKFYLLLPLFFIVLTFLGLQITFTDIFFFFQEYNTHVKAYVNDALAGGADKFNMIRISNIALALSLLFVKSIDIKTRFLIYSIIIAEPLFQVLAFSPHIGGRFYNFLTAMILLFTFSGIKIRQIVFASLLVAHSWGKFLTNMKNGYFNQDYIFNLL
jgi:hypothetical protein